VCDTHTLSHAHISTSILFTEREREAVRFMSSAQYLGLHLGWLFCKAFRVFFSGSACPVFYSAFIFAAFKATSLLFCA